MRYLTLLGIFVVCLLYRPTASSAVAMDEYPSGTYQQSCKNISMRGDDLRARCRDERGRYHDSLLDGADRCWGDIANSNGRLVCTKYGALPTGSFTQTCRDINVRFNVVRARCQNRDGDWIETSLDSAYRCEGQIENIDGHLRCANSRGDGDDRRPDYDADRNRDRDRDQNRDRDRDGDRGRDRDGDRSYGPRGSYTQTCRDIQVQGDSIRAVCQNISGDWSETFLRGYDRCVGDIVNDDGRLDCTRQGGRLVPSGSFVQTCRNAYVRGDNLRAMCQDRDGRWVWSELHEWDDCRGGIVNDNGNLRCVR